jgi:hypothetical protein
MSLAFVEVGESEGLLTYGGGIHWKPRTFETPRRKEPSSYCALSFPIFFSFQHALTFLSLQEERTKVDDIRGTPMGVGTLEEIIDDNHAIVGSSVGPEYYVTIMSFVDKDQIEPGCSVLLHNKVSFLTLSSIRPCYFLVA